VYKFSPLYALILNIYLYSFRYVIIVKFV
jgi:hypothetical protein